MQSQKGNIILVSPSPVDGYPPVRYQATLLAGAGYAVTLLTSPLELNGTVSFRCHGVKTYCIPLSAQSYVLRCFSKMKYLLYLLIFRLRLRPICELSYDPFGLFFTYICPFKPKLIIGHLHETLINPKEIFYERVVISFLKKLSVIVVADRERAYLLAQQLNLSHTPLIVRNLPLLSQNEVPAGDSTENIQTRKFSVVYHGSVGDAQALDTIVQSISLWPDGVNFHLYGLPSKMMRNKLLKIARSKKVEDRLVFEGWVDISNINKVIKRHNLGMSLLRPLNDNWRFSVGASNKRYQYMQAGVPQISDNTDGVCNLIEGNKIGLCVSPDDPKAIAESVKFFYDNPELCVDYGIRAKNLIKSQLRYDYEFEPIMNIINNAANAR